MSKWLGYDINQNPTSVICWNDAQSTTPCGKRYMVAYAEGANLAFGFGVYERCQWRVIDCRGKQVTDAEVIYFAPFEDMSDRLKVKALNPTEREWKPGCCPMCGQSWLTMRR